MARKLKPPAYLKNKGADGKLRARAVLRWPDGRVETHSLGPWGSPESYAEHQRLVAERRAAWEATALPPTFSGHIARSNQGKSPSALTSETPRSR